MAYGALQDSTPTRSMISALAVQLSPNGWLHMGEVFREVSRAFRTRQASTGSRTR